jgi:hypothetical protein
VCLGLAAANPIVLLERRHILAWSGHRHCRGARRRHPGTTTERKNNAERQNFSGGNHGRFFLHVLFLISQIWRFTGLSSRRGEHGQNVANMVEIRQTRLK